jgi:hypothetical protein
MAPPTPALKQGSLTLGKRAASLTDARDSTSKRPRLVTAGPTTEFPLKISAPNFDVASAFGKETGEEIKRKPGLDLLYFKRFLVAPGRQQLYRYLLQELPWYRVKYKVNDAPARHEYSSYVVQGSWHRR